MYTAELKCSSEVSMIVSQCMACVHAATCFLHVRHGRPSHANACEDLIIVSGLACVHCIALLQ